jgi:hypothetical protein
MVTKVVKAAIRISISPSGARHHPAENSSSMMIAPANPATG